MDGLLQELNIYNVMPEMFLSVVALALLIFGVVKGSDSVFTQIKFVIIALFAAAVIILSLPNQDSVSFGGLYLVNGFTNYSKILMIIGSAITLYLSIGYYKDNEKSKVTEFPVLMLLAVIGMMLMISANDLISFYMGLEMQSLTLYILAALHKNDARSSEAGLKYFVLGAVASGIILYGCSLIYGFSGTTNFTQLAVLYEGGQMSTGVMMGLVLLIVGLCFKVSAAPFHMWTPDVYEGSPMPVTAFFAVAPKIAAVAIFTRIMLEPFAGAVLQWQQVIVFVAAASMIVGSLGALMQTNIKRLMAYGSIGHVGFVLMSLAAASPNGVRGVLVYLLIYMVMSVGIFACIMMIKHRDGKSEEILSLSGLSKSRPMLAVAIAIIMLSMAGIPPFAGFFGKFYVLYAAIEGGLYLLAVIGVLSSVVAAYYYLRIIKIMYFDESTVPLDKMAQPEMKFVALCSAIFNLCFFIYFTPVISSAQKSAGFLF